MQEQDQDQALKGNHLMAVVRTPGVAADTVTDLRQNGYEAAYFTGEELAEAVDATGEKGGILTRLFRLFEGHLSEELNFLTHYQNEAKAGKGIVAVHLESRDEAEPLAADLVRDGAYNVRLFTALSVVDLTPESNTQAFTEVDSGETRPA